MTTYGDYLFSQEFSSVTVLPVTHSLNSKNLEIKIINSAPGASFGESIEPTDILYGADSLNEFTVFFSGSVTGYIEIAETQYYEPRFLPPDKINQLKQTDLSNIDNANIELTSSYVTLSTETDDLPNSIRIALGFGLSASLIPNVFTIRADENVVPFLNATNTFTNVNNFNQGLSGSLTRLTNGSPFLIGANGITTTINPNGSITITGPNVQNITWESQVLAPQNIAGDAAFSTTLNFSPADLDSVKLFVNGILQRQDASNGTYNLGGVGNRTVFWRSTNPDGFPIDTNDCVIVYYERTF